MVPEFNKKESFQNESCSSETKEFLYDINYIALEPQVFLEPTDYAFDMAAINSQETEIAETSCDRSDTDLSVVRRGLYSDRAIAR